jgi:hypothetical protein
VRRGTLCKGNQATPKDGPSDCTANYSNNMLQQDSTAAQSAAAISRKLDVDKLGLAAGRSSQASARVHTHP